MDRGEWVVKESELGREQRSREYNQVGLERLCDNRIAHNCWSEGTESNRRYSCHTGPRSPIKTVKN